MHLEQKNFVTMDFDRMGRRTFYKEMNGNTQVTFTRFVYKDYLCVRQVFSNSPYNTYKNFVWDPTETIATRPLKLLLPTMSLNLFYMHDGNKNVSDVVYRLTSNGVAAHYDYAPFGAVTRSVSNAVPTADITTLNPFRFSSEYHDDTLGLVYYNYRHYNPTAGRWTSRDPVVEKGGICLYSFLKNEFSNFDLLGCNRYLSPWVFSTRSSSLHLRIAVDIWECIGGKWVPSGECYTYDFYPDYKNYRTFLTALLVAPSKIDEIRAGVVNLKGYLSFPSSREQDEKIIEFLREQIKDPPIYNVLTNNCIHWSLEVFFVGMEEDNE